MEQNRSTAKVSRKEQILKAAFELVQTNSRWSMSDIADRIGTSKTALYRHFACKSDIEAAMNDQLLEGLLDVIEKTDFRPESMRKAMLNFFHNNVGYVFLFMTNSFVVPNYDHALFALLETKSPKLKYFRQSLEKLGDDKKEAVEMALLKNSVSVLIGSLHHKGIELLRKEMIAVLGAGFPDLKVPAETRLDELEEIARISESELIPGTKLFDAIAAAIKEQGIIHTTIDRIAEKMGTAKSTLYSYFSNKSAMFGEMIKTENDAIVRLCENRAGKGKTIAEQLFIIMIVQANYLLLKPDLLPVFNWIRYESLFPQGEEPHGTIDLDALVKPYLISELFPISADAPRRGAAILKWASILSTSVIIHGQRHGNDETTTRKKIRAMFKCMMSGDKEIQ